MGVYELEKQNKNLRTFIWFNNAHAYVSVQQKWKKKPGDQ